MNVESLRQLHAEKLEKARVITEKENPTKDELDQVKSLLDEADRIRQDIDLYSRLEVAQKYATEPLGPRAANVGPTPDINKPPEGFKSAGEFFQSVKNAALYPGAVDRRLLPLQAKATGLSEGVPADGGYLLQPNMAAGILERMYGIGSILSRVAVDPIGQGNSITYNGVDESSRVAGSRWGGVRGYWMAEGGTLTASKPTFRQIELKLKKVAALCYATDEQLEDTANLTSWLNRVVPDELRFQVEDAVYEGTGAGQPLGIMNAGCLVSVTRTDASNIALADVLNMYARRWAGVNDYVWLINQDVVPELLVMNQGNQNVFFPPGSWANAPEGRLLGFPVLEVEYAATMGTTGDIMLAALSQYQAITKGGIRAESSMHVQFTTDEMAFRFIYRFDGEPTWNTALTPFHGSNTQSPFVVLSTASA